MSLQMDTSNKLCFMSFAASLLQQFSLRFWDLSQRAIHAENLVQSNVENIGAQTDQET